MAAVDDRDRRERRLEIRLPALHGRHEPAQRDQRGRTRTAAAEPERERHHRALREAAEHDLLRRERQPVEPLGERREAGPEALRVGEADARHDVPVCPARRERERRPRRVAGEPALRVEQVEHRVEVVLVRAATVQEDERSLGVSGRGPLERPQAHARVQLSRGFGSGVRIGSTCARRCSKFGGRISVSPRCSMSSSVPKPGPERRDLEEDAARLAEVDRAKPEAVDHGRRPAAGLGDALPPRLVLVHRRRPGDVVDGARSGDSGLGGRLARRRSSRRASRRGSPSRRPRRARSRAPRGTRRSASPGRACTRATPSKPWSASSRGISGLSATSGWSETCATRSSCSEPFRVGEAERLAAALDRDALGAEPRGPEVERRVGADAPDDGVDHPGARAAGRGARVLEEGDVRACAPLLVRVEEVVDGRIVLVDRLLHEPQPEDARVEVDVAGRVAGDARDVMDAVEPHDPPWILACSNTSRCVSHGRRYVVSGSRARRSSSRP